MKRIISVVIAAALLLSAALCGCSTEKNDTSSSQSSENIAKATSEDEEVEYVHSQNPVIAEESRCPLSDKEVQKIIENTEAVIANSIFSGTVLLSVDNEIIFEQSYGYADSKKTENTNDTYYQIGSITKQFTGTAILMLEKEGKLSTSDTLDKYFSGYDYLKDITIDQLLKMTCGLGDYMELIEYDTEIYDKYVAAAKKSDKDAQDFIVKTILDEGVYTNPGEVYAYSNSAYYLLGVIIEQLTGMSYRDYLQQTFFDPSGMTDTFFVGDGKDYQTGYSYYEDLYISDKDDKYVAASGDYPYLFSAGSVVSTAEDLNKWLDVIDSGMFITPDDRKKVEKAEFLYNYGWNTSDGSWHHSGRTYCYSSQVFFNYNTHVKVIMLSNIPFYNDLSDEAVGIYIPLNNAVIKASK